MPVNKSHGVFVSRNAVKPLSQSDISRLYWQTTNQAHHRGQQLSSADVNESLYDTLEIGQKHTKYMRRQEQKSPLMNRAACSYQADFAAWPMGDSSENRQFAETIKGFPRMKSAPALGWESTKETELRPPRSVEELRGAKQASTGSRQSRTNTLNAFGGSKVKASYSHAEHSGPADGVPESSLVYHRNHLHLPGARPADFWSTQYSRDALAGTSNSWVRPPLAPEAVSGPRGGGADLVWDPPVRKHVTAPLCLGLPPNIDPPP